jgi:hypothetical protein
MQVQRHFCRLEIFCAIVFFGCGIASAPYFRNLNYNNVKRIFIFSFLILSVFVMNAQTGNFFTFSKSCGFVSGTECASCTGGFTSSYFDGLTIRNKGKVYAQLGAGWTAKQKGEAITFTSVDGKNYTINRTSTPYATMAAFRAAIDAMCASGGGGGGTTYTAGAGINISGTVITNTGDLSSSNELQTLSIAGQNLTLSNGGGTVVIPAATYTAGTGISIAGNVVTNTAPDQVVTITGGGINAVTGTYPNFTVTANEVDGSTSNEGSLTVGIGSLTTSLIRSNTIPSSDIVLTAGSGMSITENIPTNTITLSATDPSVNNEGALSLSAGTATTSIINSNTSGSTGITIQAGTNMAISEAGNVITISSSITAPTVTVTGGTSSQANTNAGLAGVAIGDPYWWNDGFGVHTMKRQ